jgi:hypothetical protein
MINLKQGSYPLFTVDGIDLPFNDADIGKTYKFEGVVKLDHIRPEGPVFTFEVQKLAFPEVDGEGDLTTTQRRKNAKMSAQGINVTVNLG